MQVKLKKCRECSTEFKPFKTTDKYCSFGCADLNKKPAKDKSSPAKKKRKRIKPISDSMAKKLVVYREARDEYMKEHEVCEFKDCQRLANDLHHIRGRGIYLSDVSHFMAICREHHSWIDVNTKEARELGYLI
jgi:hypothetical protein